MYFMFKGQFSRAAFIKARLAQSVKRKNTNLEVVGPTVGKNILFCILSSVLAGRLVMHIYHTE